MNPDELPRCECEFDPIGKLRKINFFNCPDDQDARTHVAANRIEQIEKQLSGRSGLTNRERRNLAKELNALKRQFTQQPSPVAEADDTRKHKRLKAEWKKLRWRSRKFAQNSLESGMVAIILSSVLWIFSNGLCGHS